MNTKYTHAEGWTRREFLGSSVALGGLTLGGALLGNGMNEAAAAEQCGINGCDYPVDIQDTQKYDYPDKLDPFVPPMQKELGPEEMRITFLGSAFPPSRKVQQMMSIFVEVGPWIPDPNGGFGRAKDSFVFDCGSGVVTNYNSMGISYGRMNKIFLTHLHADHMSDLTSIYCFGPSEDRKSPLYVWGPGPSGITSPKWGKNPRKRYDDGVKALCKHLREAMRWHTESFSFLATRLKNNTDLPTRESWGLPVKPVPVGDDPHDDGYALVPIELKWSEKGGVAYDNPETGVRITHFPVIHTRKGSIGYKLEWKGLSLIYTSDTRPEWTSVDQASGDGGVDVFIHEMILPPELLAMKNVGIDQPDYTNAAFLEGLKMAETVIESSHSPQGNFGYLLSQIHPHPRLTVLAHFPVANDTVACALNSVKNHCPWVVWNPDDPNSSNIIWATDLMVVKVTKDKIEQFSGVVSDYVYGPNDNMPLPQELATPKYHTKDGDMDPTAQLDLSTLIPQENADGTVNYCKNGY